MLCFQNSELLPAVSILVLLANANIWFYLVFIWLLPDFISLPLSRFQAHLLLSTLLQELAIVFLSTSLAGAIAFASLLKMGHFLLLHRFQVYLLLIHLLQE